MVLKLVLAVALAFPTYGVALGAAADAVERLDPGSPLYREALPHATRWREAILARNILAFVRYAYPENREWLTATLSNGKSTQYQAVFSPWEQSLRTRLAPRERALLFEEVDKPLARTALLYVTACYVNGAEGRRSWPEGAAALKETAARAGIPCQLFLRARGEWLADVGELNGWY
jgi:hypothetical protein